jgi:hypothetical protein
VRHPLPSTPQLVSFTKCQFPDRLMSSASIFAHIRCDAIQPLPNLISSAYHVENFSRSQLDLVWPLLENRSWWFRCFSKDDVLLLEVMIEVPPTAASCQDQSSWVRPLGGFEARVVGWEHLAPQSGDYEY